MIKIDLRTDQENAWYLLGVAKDLAKTLRYTKEKTTQLLNEMSSGDYKHLVETLEKEFKDLIKIKGKED